MPPQNPSSPTQPPQPASPQIPNSQQPSRPTVEFSLSPNQELKIPTPNQNPTPTPSPVRPTPPPPVPPTPPPPSKKSASFGWIKWLLLGVLVILAGLYLLGRWAGPQPTPITGLEIAIKTASSLDKNIKSDGSLWGGHLCDNATPEVCTPKELSAEMPHVGQAIFSYFLLAEASGDQTYRAKADKAVNAVLDACDTDVRMCEWNFFPISQYYFKTEEDKYLTRGMLRPAESFLAMSTTTIVNGNVGHKLASLYNATEDNRFKDKLLAVADGELGTVLGKERGRLSQDVQLVWSIYIPSFSISGDPKYLAKAEELFDNYDASKDLESFRSVDAIPIGIKAGDALLQLAQISQKGESYRTQAKSLLQFFIDNLWDSPDNKMYNGDYGFIENGTNDPQGYKSTLQNGWLIKLFIMAKNEVFQTPVKNEE